MASDQSPRFSSIQVGEPGCQQLHESGFPEIRVIAQEFLDGLDIFWHFSLASVTWSNAPRENNIWPSLRSGGNGPSLGNWEPEAISCCWNPESDTRSHREGAGGGLFLSGITDLLPLTARDASGGFRP